MRCLFGSGRLEELGLKINTPNCWLTLAPKYFLCQYTDTSLSQFHGQILLRDSFVPSSLLRFLAARERGFEPRPGHRLLAFPQWPRSCRVPGRRGDWGMRRGCKETVLGPGLARVGMALVMSLAGRSKALDR